MVSGRLFDWSVVGGSVVGGFNKTLPRYEKLVSIDFPIYGNIFSQFMGNRWGYPHLSHSWILGDFSCGPSS